VEPEFLDPGPNQPAGYLPPASDGPHGPQGAFGAPRPARPVGRPGRRESLGLVAMLLAAAILPAVAAGQTLYAVVEQNVVAREAFAVSAWGDYDVTNGADLAGHGPRFGAVLALAGAAFGLLALLALGLLRDPGAGRARRTALGIAAAATGLVGLLVGVTAAMTLQIQSAFAGYQEAAGVIEVRLRVGGAVWLSLAAVLAGGLAVTAALRVRSAFRESASGY
jgi:hypothetical protein